MKREYTAPCIMTCRIGANRHLMAGSSNAPDEYTETLNTCDGDGTDALSRKQSSVWDE